MNEPDTGQTHKKQSGTLSSLGESLVELGVIDSEQLRVASEGITVSAKCNQQLANRLVELGYASQVDLTKALARLAGRTFVTAEPSMVEPESMRALPQDYLEMYNLLPLSVADSRLVVIAENFTDLVLLKEIEQISGLSVVVLAASGDNIRKTRHAVWELLDLQQPTSQPGSCQSLDDILSGFDAEQLSVVEHKEDDDDLEASAAQSPVISLVNQIIKSAVRASASDIHIEPAEDSFQVRFRIDGDLSQYAQPPLRLIAAVVSRIKIMAQLDISERRLPQDGAISVTLGQRSIDLRVSTMASRFGEKVVIRIIERDEKARDLSTLGLSPEMLDGFRGVISQPNGIGLVTGPTGSGKTSTLYAALGELVTGRNNVSTIEDPVERVLKGVNQFQVHPKAGFTFAGALRAMLRQDPNIVMVGEIRDTETAKLATEAALTGHLVLSTLHTNDAVTAIPRLINMGVEPYLVAATLRGVIAQRLVKRICPACCELSQVTDAEQAFLQAMRHDSHESGFSRGSGCARCSQRGTRGRIGIFELLSLNESVTTDIIRSLNQGSGSSTGVHSSPAFWKDGIKKAQAGEILLSSLMQIVSPLNQGEIGNNPGISLAA